MSGAPFHRRLHGALALAIALVAVPCAAGTVGRARWLMGTLWSAEATAGRDSAATGAALDAALDEVARLEQALSNWRPDSELSRLNAAGSADSLSPALAAVLDSSLVWAAATEGAFDPTVESLTRAWDVRGRGRVPTAAALATARAQVGWRQVHARRDADGRLRGVDLQGTALDLGGIGKGFALDRAADVLRARGIDEAMLDAGGQRFVLGRDTTIALADPRDRDRLAVIVRLATRSLATSTQRERSLLVHGRRVGHILDPRTGQPLPTRAAVSVAASSATRADALSTALLVMGHDAARDFVRAHPDLAALWLEPHGTRLRADAWGLTIVERAPHVLP